LVAGDRLLRANSFWVTNRVMQAFVTHQNLMMI
jgi:hypothetical protein